MRAATVSKRVCVAALLGGLACYAQQPSITDLRPSASVPSDALTQAQSLIAASRFHAAEGVLRVYLSSNNDSAVGHSMLAYALLRENNPRDSLTEYTRAAAIEKPSSEMLERVGQDYALLADWADAEKWTLAAVQMDPSNGDAWYSLGRIRYTNQRFGDALPCFQQALKLSPESVKVENNLGLVYEALNQTDTAIAAYRQAIVWQNEKPATQKSEQPLLNLSIALLHRGQYEEAAPLLSEASTISPKDPRIFEQLGQLHMQKGDFASARQDFQRACGLDPKNSGLHFLLGQAYRHLGQQQEAKAEFGLSAQLANAKNQ